MSRKAAASPGRNSVRPSPSKSALAAAPARSCSTCVMVAQAGFRHARVSRASSARRARLWSTMGRSALSGAGAATISRAAASGPASRADGHRKGKAAGSRLAAAERSAARSRPSSRPTDKALPGAASAAASLAGNPRRTGLQRNARADRCLVGGRRRQTGPTHHPLPDILALQPHVGQQPVVQRCETLHCEIPVQPYLQTLPHIGLHS